MQLPVPFLNWRQTQDNLSVCVSGGIDERPRLLKRIVCFLAANHGWGFGSGTRGKNWQPDRFQFITFCVGEPFEVCPVCADRVQFPVPVAV